MEKNMSFSEAYNLFKKNEAREFHTRGKRAESLSYVITQEELDAIMHKAKAILEDHSLSGLKNIKTLLSTITESFVPQVTQWQDNIHLNILHHAIINNRSDIVNFFLADTPFFPKTHFPYLNPYAHLAALLGHKDCLHAILQHRPADFFKITQPTQFLRLPEEYIKRFKVKDTVKNNFLDKIKSVIGNMEEKKLEQADITNMLDLVEEEKQDKKKRRSSSKRHASIGSTTKKNQQNFTNAHGGKTRSPYFKKIAKLNEQITGATDSFLPQHKFGGRLSKIHSDKRFNVKGQHYLTVYWNVFDDDELGVLNGAGSPIHLHHANGGKAIRTHYRDLVFFRDDNSRTSHLGDMVKKLQWNIENVKYSISQAGRTSSRKLTLSRPTSVTAATARKAHSVKPHVVKSRIDIGVRGKKKYKDFHIKIDHREAKEKDESQRSMNKTPLTIAAERGNLECVQFILEHVILKANPTITTKEPLTLATKARSPEAILLLVQKKMSRWDYQSAVLVAIRELYPDCLTALLTISGKERSSLFDGVNLFHVLYAQSLLTNYRYELMPDMTRVLISCKENVNAHNVPRTFPIYTLISCAFNISNIKQIYYYLECLIILLETKANPHYSEEKAERDCAKSTSLSFTRKSFTSAIHCILESAKSSLDFFEKPYLSKMLVKKFITTIETHDKTKRTTLNDALFDYTKYANFLGLHKSIIKSLLRYGANPDSKRAGKYAVNFYFENILPYLSKFQVDNSYDYYRRELDDLMYIARGMSSKCLHEALKIFLDEHILLAPIQALPVCRYFAYLMNKMVRSPRPLAEITAQLIWLCLGRNKIRAKSLLLPEDLLVLVIP